ncbi:MAG: hypothetical protein KatS3mg043_0820 [Rhodothermaceae bacterium]|nr:MAG: hypothetical protein KatS3mg043_0820 [Rhodothermaceae bacterium]
MHGSGETGPVAGGTGPLDPLEELGGVQQKRFDQLAQKNPLAFVELPELLDHFGLQERGGGAVAAVRPVRRAGGRPGGLHLTLVRALLHPG